MSALNVYSMGSSDYNFIANPVGYVGITNLESDATDDSFEISYNKQVESVIFRFRTITGENVNIEGFILNQDSVTVPGMTSETIDSTGTIEATYTPIMPISPFVPMKFKLVGTRIPLYTSLMFLNILITVAS